MSVISTAAGLLLIGLALYDAFRTLFVPEGRGALNSRVSGLLWGAFRRVARAVPGPEPRHAILRLAGPAIFVAVLLGWTVALAVGFALIYLPAMPDQFRIGTGLDPAEQDDIVDAIYFSFSTLSSSGFGDISAESRSMRVTAIAEGVCGMVVLGVGLSWLLSLYPAIRRRRAIAEGITLHERAGLGIDEMAPDLASSRLQTLTPGIIEVSRDLAKFPILYYFMESRSDASLPRQIDSLCRLAEQARSSDDLGVRQAGALLEAALESLERTLSDRFYGGELEGETVLARFRSDHLVDA